MVCKKCNNDGLSKAIKMLTWGFYLAPVAYATYTILRDTGLIDKVKTKAEPVLEDITEELSGFADSLKEKRDEAATFLKEHADLVTDYTLDCIRRMSMSSIEKLIEGLNYQSESDKLWEYSEFDYSQDGNITCDTIKEKFNIQNRVTCVTQDFEARFTHFINTQPQSAQYENLHNALVAELTGIQMFRINPSRVENFNFDLYVAGIDAEETLVIINTSGVET